jgi:hypothetical protein
MPRARSVRLMNTGFPIVKSSKGVGKASVSVRFV